MTSYLESGISIQELREKRKLKVEKYIALGLGLYCFLIANIITSLTIIFFFGPQISVIFNGPPEITNVRKSSPPFPFPISPTPTTPKETVTTSITPVTISFTSSPSIVTTYAVTSKTDNQLIKALTLTPLQEMNYNGFEFSIDVDGDLFKTSENCEFLGDNFAEIGNSTYRSCSITCAENSKCGRFSFRFTTKTCYLKQLSDSNPTPIFSHNSYCGYVIGRPTMTSAKSTTLTIIS